MAPQMKKTGQNIVSFNSIFLKVSVDNWKALNTPAKNAL